MPKTDQPTKCEWCGDEIEQKLYGPVRKFCKGSHRQRAYEERTFKRVDGRKGSTRTVTGKKPATKKVRTLAAKKPALKVIKGGKQGKVAPRPKAKARKK